MKTCPNCGKVAGFHSSILQGCQECQGCACQHSMQAQSQRTEPLIGCVNHDCAQCKQRKPLTDQTIETKAANLENATSDVKWGFEQGAKWARENT